MPELTSSKEKSGGISDIIKSAGLSNVSGFGGKLGGNNIQDESNPNLSVKMKDYLPGGDKLTTWSGIDLGSLASSPIGGLLSNVFGKSSSKGIAGLLDSVKGGNALGGVTQHLDGLNKSAGGITNSFNSQLANMTDAQKAILNNPKTEALRIANNQNFINSKLPFIGGLSTDALDNAKSITTSTGELLTGDNAKIYEKMGLVSNGLFPGAGPSPSGTVNLSWGQALQQAVRNPTVMQGAVNVLGALSPSVMEKIQNSGSGLSEMLPENMVINDEMSAYTAALTAGYNMLSDQDKELLSLYSYYKMNMNARAANGGEGFNLGQEVSDSFYGSINYNVTNFLDGAGDYVAETWQNISYIGAEYVREQFDSFYNFSSALENATGVKLSLDPKFQDATYNVMEKLGFGNLGIGTDTQAHLISTLKIKTDISLDSGNGPVVIDDSNVVYYYERYDYRHKLTAERRFKVRLTNEQLTNLDIQSPDLVATIKRRYGFTLGQDPAGTYPMDMNVQYQEIERDALTNWPAKSIGAETKGSKDQMKKQAEKSKAGNNTGKPDDLKNGLVFQELEFMITPPLLTKNSTGEVFNGIPEGENTISELLQKAFETSYDEGKSCIAEPKNNFVLKDVAIPPTNFNGLLQQFQKEYNIYEGGPVVFQDRLNVNGKEEDVYFVMPKRGVVNMEYDEGWTVEFRVRQIDTPHDAEMVGYLIPSRKKIIWPITEDMIKTPGNSTEYSQPEESRHSKGSTVGAIQPIKNESTDQIVIQSNTEYITPTPMNNKKFDHIYIKVPNTYFTFTPGDMVTLKWRGQSYKGNVKEWASQYSKNHRITLLVLVMEQDPDKKSFMDKLSPGNWIEKMQETIAKTNANITNKLNSMTEKTGNWLQNQFESFSKWEDENLTFKGMNILEWMNKIDPNIAVPTFDQAGNLAGTMADVQRTMYGIDFDDPFSNGTLVSSGTTLAKDGKTTSWVNSTIDPATNKTSLSIFK